MPWHVYGVWIFAWEHGTCPPKLSFISITPAGSALKEHRVEKKIKTTSYLELITLTPVEESKCCGFESHFSRAFHAKVLWVRTLAWNWHQVHALCNPLGSITFRLCERAETFARFPSRAAFINYCCGLGDMQIFAATHAAQLITHTYTTGGPNERVVAF